MRRGKVIFAWSEPASWHQAAKEVAQAEGIRRLPRLSWIWGIGLFGGWMVWEWLEADPAVRASIPRLISIIAVASGGFIGLGWLIVRLSRFKKTTLCEGGVVHGSRTTKKWIPWSRIEFFYVEETPFGGWTFRFLTWKGVDEEEESYSVVPDSIEISQIVDIFKNHGVEQIPPPEDD